jgi:RNA polymerase sigma factor (sigma-70 family)
MTLLSVAVPLGQSDADLLAQYVRTGGDEPFRSLVERYGGMVRAAARRQLGDCPLVDDVVQAVFILLARKARRIARPAMLAGWLVNATHFCCRDARKSNARRRAHEQKAAQMKAAIQATGANPADDLRWLGELDGALARLRERDRAVIALRYLQGRSVIDVAAAVGVSESAAAKRIERALAKLRRILTRRGAILPAAGLALAISAHVATATPVAASTIMSQAAIAAATAKGVIPAALSASNPWSIAKGAGQLMNLAKLKVAAVAASAVVLTAGGGAAAVTHYSRGGAGTVPIAVPPAVIVPQAQPQPQPQPITPTQTPREGPSQLPVTPPSLAPKPGTLLIAGVVWGTVKFDGQPPEMPKIDMSAVPQCHQQHAGDARQESVIVGENGGLANVVVSLKKQEGQDLPGTVPAEPAVLDQKGCQYVPHVVAVMVGQRIIVKNSDPFLHNVHPLPEKNEGENRAMPNRDEAGARLKTPKEPEYFRVKCDVHPWMAAWVAVLDNPYFAVTGKDGKFTLPKGLPDGDYTLTAWHEKYGEQTGHLTVKDGAGTVDFIFKAQLRCAPRRARDTRVAVGLLFRHAPIPSP